MIICDERISLYYLGTNYLLQNKNFVSNRQNIFLDQISYREIRIFLKKLFRVFRRSRNQMKRFLYGRNRVIWVCFKKNHNSDKEIRTLNVEILPERWWWRWSESSRVRRKQEIDEVLLREKKEVYVSVKSGNEVEWGFYTIKRRERNIWVPMWWRLCFKLNDEILTHTPSRAFTRLLTVSGVQ